MKVFFVFSTLFFSANCLLAQTDPVKFSVYLIGNTGADTIPSEGMQLLAFECFDDSSSAVILLGNNVFNDGLNPRHSPNQAYLAKRKLLSQLELFVSYRGGLYATGGNHDWSRGKSSGLIAILEQERVFNAWLKDNSMALNSKSGGFYPGFGIPGPKRISVDETVDLLFIDSQWFLQKGFLKPRGKLSGMSFKAQKKLVFKQLDSLLALGNTQNKTQIVVAHHPIYTNGKHSHTNDPLRFLVNYSPLQVLGWFGLNRYFNQDITQPRYRRYRNSIHETLKKYPNTIYASAHEHNMQALKKDSVNYIISGAGSKLTDIDRYRFPAFFMDDLQLGFFKLTIHESGKVQLHAMGVTDRGEYWKSTIIAPKK